MTQKRKRTYAKPSQGETDHPIAHRRPEGEFDVVIVGGGASGLACAIACAQSAKQARTSLRIAILEAHQRIGASIMRSGNGRCNFSHASIDAACYRNAAFVEEAYQALAQNPMIPSVIEWFEGLGLVWEEMPGSDGLLYPFSYKANSVLDALRCALDDHRIEVFERTCVRAVSKGSSRASGQASFMVEYEMAGDATADEERPSSRRKGLKGPFDTVTGTVSARAVVVAAGGMGGIACGRMLTPFGLAHEPERAVLGPLKAHPSRGVSLAMLDGIRMKATVSVPAREFSEEGEVLFRKYGISGIVVFNASRYAREGDELFLDLVPRLNEGQLEALLCRRARMLQRPAKSFLVGFVVAPLAQAIMKVADVDQARIVAADQAKKIAQALKRFPFTVEGIADERSCQVKCGGVRIDEVNPATLQVKSMPGLYVLGEALDVDGPCGGYNLHWAWATGLLAGFDIGSE